MDEEYFRFAGQVVRDAREVIRLNLRPDDLSREVDCFLSRLKVYEGESAKVNHKNIAA